MVVGALTVIASIVRIKTRSRKPMDDTLKAAAEQVKQQLRDKVEAIKGDPQVAELLKLQKGLNSLEVLE
jgi:hypothetical protein